MASLRIQHCLFGIVGLFSTLRIAGGIEMYTDPKIMAICGQTLTLKCNIVAKDSIELKQLYWMEKKEICDYTKPSENQTGTDFECQRLSNSSPVGRIYNYSLIISNIQPKHQGTYHCKLRSNQGVENSQTIVRVQNCVGNSSKHVSSTEWSCTFKDVYPKPIIRWRQGDDNFTDLAETKVTETAAGLFTVVSKIKVMKGPKNRPYNCSLWLYMENENNEMQFEYVGSEGFSGGHKLIGHWFGVMLAMVLGVLLA